MENTPPPSDSGKNVADMSTRVFGGRFADLKTGIVVKHNVHDHGVMANVTDAFAEVEILNLSAFVVVSPGAMSSNVTVYLGWGHCEHSAPRDIAGMAQLPNFKVYHFSNGNISSTDESSLICSFSNSVSKFLKPIQLYGGRPSLFAYAQMIDEDGKLVNSVAAQLFYRATVRTSGADIVIV
uniref:CP n=1 Tax=Liriodendron tulipifera tymovirus 1 TaxID=2799338 RepID=A0A7T5QZA6_9VIRU|nr:CP [Liriodendron tulipifera tymovirus 1]